MIVEEKKEVTRPDVAHTVRYIRDNPKLQQQWPPGLFVVDNYVTPELE